MKVPKTYYSMSTREISSYTIKIPQVIHLSLSWIENKVHPQYSKCQATKGIKNKRQIMVYNNNNKKKLPIG